MLVFLVLCAIIQRLQGAPLLPPHGSDFMATIDLIIREAPEASDCGGPHCRTVNSILQSCLFTIFACVWTSAHPNIDGPRDSVWTCLKRKVVTMLCVVIAPELALWWALDQHSGAQAIAKMYNSNFARTSTGKTKRSLWEKVVGLFQPLPKYTTRRGNGQPWTATHGFFIQMGGFILYENEYPKEVLDYDRLAELLRNKYIDAPTVTERDIQDRSKGDAISKAIVVVQTVWFVLQCVARWGQHLRLSELEVLTLAFAVVNVAIYVVWWDKPQGVGTAICVPLKSAVEEINATPTPLVGDEQREWENLSHTELASLPEVNYQHSLISDNGPLISHHEQERDEHTGEKQSWLRRKLHQDRKQHSFPFFLLVFLPYRIVFSVLRRLGKMGENPEFEKKGLRVPMFYASHYNDDRPTLVSCVIGTIFGAIHLTAWTSEFPSHRDLVIWRVSAIVLTVVPLLLFSATATELLGMDAIARYIGLSSLLLMPFYVTARLVLIIIALLAFRHPPRDVLRDVSWTSYIPHF